jgi:pimeloyl-ACP methyl ester carboxylesterase
MAGLAPADVDDLISLSPCPKSQRDFVHLEAPQGPSVGSMELYVAEWGQGTRTAVLVHGMSDDHSTWWQVAPFLAAQGFRVLAPDLRGHGRSPRSDRYLLADYADDLVQCLPSDVEILLGHSLGALAVGMVAPALAPRSIVYLDPPWRTSLPDVPEEGEPSSWSDEDRAVDERSSALMDPQVPSWVPAMMTTELAAAIPSALLAPTLVVEPETGALTEVAVRNRLSEAGYDFRTLPGVRHVMHRDDLTAFLTVLEEFLNRPRPPEWGRLSGESQRDAPSDLPQSGGWQR